MARLKHKYAVANEAATENLAEGLAELAAPGDVFCLFGPLGSGKSVFARAFIRALCGAQTEVPSPTFTVVQHYDAPDFEIAHADLYRLQNPEEIVEIGLEDGFDDAVTLIEWPQRLGRFMPAARLDLTLVIAENCARIITLTAHGARWTNEMEHSS